VSASRRFCAARRAEVANLLDFGAKIDTLNRFQRFGRLKSGISVASAQKLKCFLHRYSQSRWRPHKPASCAMAIDLLPQRHRKIFDAERLLNETVIRMRGWRAGLPIPRRENERACALGQEIGDGIDLLAPQIDVKQGNVDFFAANDIEGCSHAGDGRDDVESELLQHVVEHDRDDRFVFNDEYAWSFCVVERH
jgi:hypothetical protein